MDSGGFLPAGIVKRKIGAASEAQKKEVERINPTAYATAIFNKFAQRANISKVVYCVCHSGTNLSATDLFDQVAPLNALAEGAKNGDDHNNYYVYRDILELQDVPGNDTLVVETKKLNTATGKKTIPLRKQSPFTFSLSQLLGFNKETIIRIPDLVYVPKNIPHNWSYVPARNISFAALKDLVIFYDKKKIDHQTRPPLISAALSRQKSDAQLALENLSEAIQKKEKEKEQQMLKVPEGIVELPVSGQPPVMQSGKPAGMLQSAKTFGTIKNKAVLPKPTMKIFRPAPASKAKQLKGALGPLRHKAGIPKSRPIPKAELVMDPDFFTDIFFMETLYRNFSLPSNKQAMDRNNTLLIKESVGKVPVIPQPLEVRKAVCTNPKHLDDMAIRPGRAQDGTIRRAKSTGPEKLPAVVPPVERQKQDIKIENRKIITV